MADLPTASADLAQNAILANGTTYYCSLCPVDPGSSTTPTEITGITRQAFTVAASSGGSQASNNAQAFTTFPTLQATNLSAAITTTAATSISVISATGFPSAGNFIIQIGAEFLLVTAGQGTTTWTVTRGYASTIAATAVSGATTTLAIGWFLINTAVTSGTYRRGGVLTTPIVPPSGSTVNIASAGVTFTLS